MRTLKFNGEAWYWDERSLWKRVRQWLIWIGGWELANGKGWHFYLAHYHKPNGRRVLMHPTPVSVFGHRFTWFGWGWHLSLPFGSMLVWDRGDLFMRHHGEKQYFRHRRQKER